MTMPLDVETVTRLWKQAERDVMSRASFSFRMRFAALICEYLEKRKV